MLFLPVFFAQQEQEEDGDEEDDEVDEEMSLYGFISSITVPLETGVQVCTHSEGRERRIRVLQEVMK